MLRETLLMVSAGLVISATACSSDDGKPDDGSAVGQGTGSTGGGGGGAAVPVGTGGLLLTEIEAGPTGGTRELTEDEVCVGVALETESVVREIPRETTTQREVQEPVAMYIMLDNSKSMAQSDDGTHTTWEQAVIALTDFVQDPTSEGIDVGIQFFWPVNVDDDDECAGAAHAQSAIDVGRLPEVAPAVVEALASTEPHSGTPTVGALTGAVDFCTTFQQQHPDEQCVVVFITDGQPNGCGLTLDCTPGFTPDHKNQCVDPEAEAVLTPIAAAGASAGVKDVHGGHGGRQPRWFRSLERAGRGGGFRLQPKRSRRRGLQHFRDGRCRPTGGAQLDPRYDRGDRNRDVHRDGDRYGGHSLQLDRP